MKPAFDKASVIKTLKDGLRKGYWTLEDLDKPTENSAYNFKVRKQALIQSMGTNFQEEVHMPKFKNLLRDDSTDDAVHVEVVDPRDFLPPFKDA